MIEWTKKDIELISSAPPITEENFRMTLGGVTRLCNLYERIPEQIHGLNAELEQAKKQLANAKEQYGKAARTYFYKNRVTFDQKTLFFISEK